MVFFLPSYPAVIWNALKQGLNYIVAQIAADDTLTGQSAAVLAMDNSLKFGLTAIEADMFYQASSANYMNLSPVPTFDITIPTATRNFMQTRIDALQAALQSIAALAGMATPRILVQPVSSVSQALLAGAPIFPDPGYIEWLILFDFETPPAGLTITNFVAQAQAAATAWVTIATALQTQGVPYSGATLNTVNQMGSCAQVAADELAHLSVVITASTNAATISSNTLSFTEVPAGITTGMLVTDIGGVWVIQPGVTVIGQTATTVTLSDIVAVVAQGDLIQFGSALPSATDLRVAWNTLVAAPTLTRLASLVANDPTSMAVQNTSVIRYTILGLMNGFNALVVALRQLGLQQVNLATVQQNDSLMDIAARELGDYSKWYQIAQVNALVPPFIGPSAMPGITSQGRQLFMPNTTSTIARGDAPNYAINYLGVDIYYGPLNQPMTPWSGDFNAIAGYRNLAFSLGRRLQTTLGDLIYHLDFGSRVPPEVGAIASDTEATLLSAYTESALRSDPRVAKVLAINTQALPNYLVSITSTVLPNGIGALSVPVNEVIGPVVR